MIGIRQLSVSDTTAYKDIRLEMLHACPEYFGGSYEESKKLPLEKFERTIKEKIIIGVFNNSDWKKGH